MRCRVCDQPLRKMTVTHLRKHNMTLGEYLGVDKDSLYTLYVEKGMSTRDIAELLGSKDHKTVSRLLRKHGIAVGSPFSENSGKPLNVNLKPDEKLAYFAGIMLGDGSVHKNTVGLTSKDKAFAQSFYECLVKLGLNPTLWFGNVHKGNKYWRVAGYSSVLSNWVRELTLKSLEKLIDKNVDKVKSFIRGFYEAEGTHINDQRKRDIHIRIHNNDHRKINLIVKLLHNLGFNPRIYTYDRNGVTEYQVHIGGRNEVARFLKMIKPTIKRGEKR